MQTHTHVHTHKRFKRAPVQTLEHRHNAAFALSTACRLLSSCFFFFSQLVAYSLCLSMSFVHNLHSCEKAIAWITTHKHKFNACIGLWLKCVCVVSPCIWMFQSLCHVLSPLIPIIHATLTHADETFCISLIQVFCWLFPNNFIWFKLVFFFLATHVTVRNQSDLFPYSNCLARLSWNTFKFLRFEWIFLSTDQFLHAFLASVLLRDIVLCFVFAFAYIVSNDVKREDCDILRVFGYFSQFTFGWK